MLDPMDGADEQWGQRLGRWRRDHMHWSQQELVDRIVRVAYETNEGRGTALDVRLVNRWESGRVQRPQAVYRRLLARLGAPLPGPAPIAPVVQWGLPGEEGDCPVQRRELFRAGTALVAPGLLGALTTGEPARTGPDLLDELTDRLTSLRRLDDTLGGADTYRLYASEAALTRHLLSDGVHRDPVLRRLLGLHAEQAQQAGWAAFDAGWQETARDHFRQSHAAATEAGDTGLAGNALALHAYQLISVGRAARAVSERAVDAADQPGVAPGVRALLYSRAAWTFALDGDAEATAQCLGRAEDALAQADGGTPGYASWVDPTELTIMAGRCWSELGRPLRAVPVLKKALDGFSDARARDKALYSSWLAESYIDAGEVEQAASVVQTSLAILGTTSSVRPRERLAAVAGRLAEHRELPVVRDLLRGHSLHPFDVRR